MPFNRPDFDDLNKLAHIKKYKKDAVLFKNIKEVWDEFFGFTPLREMKIHEIPYQLKSVDMIADTTADTTVDKKF